MDRYNRAWRELQDAEADPPEEEIPSNSLVNRIFSGLLVALFLFIPLWLLYKARWTDLPKPPAAVTCYEDEPCWNCSTMGNLECGK